jgi:hypothetical protein
MAIYKYLRACFYKCMKYRYKIPFLKTGTVFVMLLYVAHKKLATGIDLLVLTSFSYSN